MKERLLIVDDDDAFRERLMAACASRGHQVVGANNKETALSATEKICFDWILLDLNLAGASGLELLAAIKAEDPEVRIVVLTGYGSIATALEAVRLGAFNYLMKPADTDTILSAFRSVNRAEDLSVSQVPSLDQVEWEHIQRVLSDCSGNISRAAKLLGVHRRSLQRKLARAPLT